MLEDLPANGKLTQWLEFLLLLGTLVPLYFSPKLFRWLMSTAKNAYYTLKAVRELPEAMVTLNRIAALDKAVATVLGQVMPNGGSSLRDAVNKTAQGQDQVLTELRDVKRTLALQNGVLRAYIDSDGDSAAFETDGLGRNTWVNKTYTRWVNQSRETLMGYGWTNSIAPSDRERVREEWELAISERREFAMRYRMRDAAGHTFLVDCKAVPVAVEDPDFPDRWVGHLVRVTEHDHD